MKKLNFFALTASVLALVTAHESQAGWKLDADGKIEMRDGNPIYVDSSGKEMTVGGNKIAELNAEAKSHREAKEAALEKLKAFGDLDPVKAKEAITKLEAIDQSKLLDSGKVDELKAQIKQAYELQIGERDKKLAEQQGTIDSMIIDNVFNGSEFLRDNIAVPRDMFIATFRGAFKVEDGKPVAYDRVTGNKLTSTERVGELATPEEALKQLVSNHPNKETILKADVGNGTGNNGKGGNSGLGRSMKRSAFDAESSPIKKAELAAKVGKGELTLVD